MSPLYLLADVIYEWLPDKPAINFNGYDMACFITKKDISIFASLVSSRHVLCSNPFNIEVLGFALLRLKLKTPFDT